MLSPQTIIADLLGASPQLAGLLLELRVDCIGCSMNKFCTLEDLCSRYGLDLDQIISRIQTKLSHVED